MRKTILGLAGLGLLATSSCIEEGTGGTDSSSGDTTSTGRTEGGEPSEGSGATGGSNGAGTVGASSTPSYPVWPDFQLELEEGTFWDFAGRSFTTSYGSGSRPSSDVFRLTLGAPTTIDGVTLYEVHTFPIGLASRWTAIGFHDGVLYGADGETLHEIFDANTSLWVGGGFFADFPNEVLRARQGSFSNGIVSGSGIVVERSTESSDTVCDPDFGCVSGGDPDTLLVQRELYQNGVGPAGYYFQFTINDGFDAQLTTTEEVGLRASSLRGDEGFFDAEDEDNDSVASASQSLEDGRTIIGTFSTEDDGFIESHTYINPQGIAIGSATDRLQDCFDVDVSGTTAPSFMLRWDPAKTCTSCRFSIVLYGAEQSPVASSSTIEPDFANGYVIEYLFDNEISSYGTRYTLCVGTTNPIDIPYTLELN